MEISIIKRSFKLLMKKKVMHVESKDLEILARTGKVKADAGRKVLRMSKGLIVGLKTWGRIDFLTQHRGWVLVTVKSRQDTVKG